MLKEILSISGKPGLFKLVSQSKNMIIVESLTDGKRTPAYSHDKITALGDIAIFAETSEVPLREVFLKIQEKEKGEKLAIDPKSNNDALRAFFAEILPDFDRDRVYPTDIKKVIQWYNLLVDAKLTDFSEPKESEAGEEVAVKHADTDKEAKAAVAKAAKAGNRTASAASKAPMKKTAASVKKG